MQLLKIMSLKGFIIFAILMSISSAEYYVNNSRKFNYLRGEFPSFKRQSRFISFQTLDDDLKLAMEFVVPFLSIPAKKSVDETSNTAQGYLNINLAALVITGITVIAGVSTASALTHLAQMATGKRKAQRSEDIFSDISSFALGYRGLDGEKAEAPLSDIVSNVEAIFRDYGVDLTSCIQKTICLLVQESTKNVATGKGTSSNKIIDGLTSTNWLLSFISGTAIKEAIDIGRSSYDCQFKYILCNWTEEDIKEFIDSM